MVQICYLEKCDINIFCAVTDEIIQTTKCGISLALYFLPTQIILHKNKSTCSIPSELGFCESVNTFDSLNNNLQGTIKSFLVDLWCVIVNHYS